MTLYYLETDAPYTPQVIDPEFVTHNGLFIVARRRVDSRMVQLFYNRIFASPQGIGCPNARPLTNKDIQELIHYGTIKTKTESSTTDNVG